MNKFDSVGGFKPYKRERNPINKIELPYNKIKAYDMDTEMEVKLLTLDEYAENVNNIAFFILSNSRDEFVNVTDYTVEDGVVKFKMPKIEEGKYYPQIMDSSGKVYSSTDNEYIDVVYNRESRVNELFPIIKDQVIDEVTPAVKQYLLDNKEQFTGPNGKQGVRGDKGEKGEKGDRGLRGNRGPEGEKGDTGEPGPQGEKGDRGFRGNRGAPGPQGPEGEKGDKGDTGAVDFDSITEEQIEMLRGPEGPQGPQGERGADGVINTIEGHFALQGDETGDLWLYYHDETTPPEFEVDDDNNIWMLFEAESV